MIDILLKCKVKEKNDNEWVKAATNQGQRLKGIPGHQGYTLASICTVNLQAAAYIRTLICPLSRPYSQQKA